ncbi:MAG: methionyl-tRNA formyltransferase [Patescibacteria group bacterium]
MLSKQTRVVFFGTPDLAIPALQALVESGVLILAVVTQPDRPVGRKQLMTPPPVKVWAEEHHLNVIQPQKIRTLEFETWLKDQKPDICVVVAYGKIFPESLLKVPPKGFVNIHPSLLPELRGATPIPFAILNGLHETGVTIMLMDAGMDTGPILLQEKINLPARATYRWLHDQLKELGATLLIQALEGYLNGTISPTPQSGEGSKTTLLDRTHGEVSWEAGAEKIDRMWRAFHPFPGVTVLSEGTRLKLIECDLQGQYLIIKKIQPEGKSSMSGAAFRRGNPNWPAPPWVTWAE